MTNKIQTPEELTLWIYQRAIGRKFDRQLEKAIAVDGNRAARIIGRHLWRAWNIHDLRSPDAGIRYQKIADKIGHTHALGLAEMLNDRILITGEFRNQVRRYISASVGHLLN